MIKRIGTSTTSGGQRKAKEEARRKEMKIKATEGRETQTREESKANAAGVKNQDTGQANATRRQLSSEAWARTTYIKLKKTTRREHT